MRKMRVDRFRVIVISRVLLLNATIFIFLYLLMNPMPLMTKILMGVLVIYQIYRLIHFVEKSNRELNRFLQSIQYDDFTQTFSDKSLGDSFDNLRKSFNQIIRRFLKLRSEKEEHFRYLQTVIKHVGVGLISYKANGEVELLNTAARRLLNVNFVKNIKFLEHFSKPLVNRLLNLKPGESTALKIETNGKTLYLSIYATQFKIKGQSYTLASLQDIQPEIEMEHMAKELEIAWNVQKSLLPAKNPNIPGFDIAGLCKPAKEVGGDYYDFISLGKNKLAMIIGDVSGKGISASFYMTLTKGFIQSHMRENTSPREVLIKVNELMYKTIDRRSFVTMFIAVLDWKLRRIVCARAGHNPAIHYSGKSGESVLVKPGGIALGLRKTGVFSKTLREYPLQIDDHDWFIMYTDGFIDAVDADANAFGQERLIRALKENDKNNAAGMVDTLFEKIQDFSPFAAHHDDMTMIGIKALPTTQGETGI
ncbi:MAG: SpoIIE family protein phosphatase [Candidatus Aminicenantes bacterium]|nr:MAG: SpoIIE family protein phosphatase [Candidatus Aminicenantes bacterium]